MKLRGGTGSVFVEELCFSSSCKQEALQCTAQGLNPFRSKTLILGVCMRVTTYSINQWSSTFCAVRAIFPFSKMLAGRSVATL